MQAEEFGYAVSPMTAVHTPATFADVQEGRRAAKVMIGILVVWMLAAAGLLVWYNVTTSDTVGRVVLVCGVGLIMTSIMPVGIALDTVPLGFRAAAETGRRPWQAWPCRLDRIRGDKSLRRVFLLAPDGSVVREFRGRVPEDLWQGMDDGLGVLWFCGDLRFGGVMARPGGAPLWLVKPAKDGRGPADGGTGRGARMNGLVGEAVGTAFGDWIG
ncbi:hypothetical protein [Embleya sp. NPDC050493]|uniref:hypothetical protein n=1 Tax=Embleya sp. NPDC050493 TaxID=3363989 RepID=UPI0037A2C952